MSLTGATLDGADLRGAVLRDAELDAATLAGARIDDTTVLPRGMRAALGEPRCGSTPGRWRTRPPIR